MQVFLDTRKFVEQRMVLYEVFRQNEAKKFRTEFCNNTPLFYPYFFPYQNFSGTHNGSPTKIFGHCLTKNFRWKNCDTPYHA